MAGAKNYKEKVVTCPTKTVRRSRSLSNNKQESLQAKKDVPLYKKHETLTAEDEDKLKELSSLCPDAMSLLIQKLDKELYDLSFQETRILNRAKFLGMMSSKIKSKQFFNCFA